MQLFKLFQPRQLKIGIIKIIKRNSGIQKHPKNVDIMVKMRPKLKIRNPFRSLNKSKKGRNSYKHVKGKNILTPLWFLIPHGISGRIFLLSIILTFLGLLFIADVSAPEAISVFQDEFYYAKQQFVWGIVGIAAMFVVSNIKVSFWEKWSTPIFVLSLILLLLVLIPGLSVKVLGARRWLNLGPVRLQPSEFLKLGLVLYFAKLAKNSKRLMSYVIPLAIVALLIMFQPDLGTTLVVSIIGLSQILISGVGMMSMVPLVIGSVLLALFFIFSSDYRRQRLMSFIDPLSDVQGGSYHIQQIIFALASGGLFGLGLGQSKQKYLFLPEASTDSIFAIIGEEIGFFGSCAILILYLILLINMFAVIKKTTNSYSRVLAVGITSWLGSQTLINLGSIVSAIPFTGVPLPFLSYGGSSLVALLTATGIIISIAKENE